MILLIACQTNFGQSEGEFKTSDGVVLHYKIRGEGKTVLLLAGGPGLSGSYMQPIADEVSKYAQTVLLDQRGTGKSVLSVTDAKTVNLQKAINDIEELRTHLKKEKITILGHSFGGLLAMNYAAAFPDKVESLILVGSGGLSFESFKYLQANIIARLNQNDLDALEFWANPERSAKNPERASIERLRAITPAYFFNRKKSLEIIAETTPETFNYKVNELVSRDIITPNYDLRPKLKDFKQPVLIVQGRQDIIGESTAYLIFETMKNSRLEFVEQAGHFAWLEQPQAFFPLIKEFLTGKN